jgi:SAM-dependent methyltransferase
MQRDRCGGCGSDQLEVFLDLGSTPLADRFPATPDEPEDTWPLEVAVCRACWLVQLLEVVPDELLWDVSYGFYSGASPSKVAEHQALAAELLATYPEQAKRLTVEIACNDGDLLRHFHAAGCPVVGIDPAEGPMLQTFAWLLDRYVEPFGRAAAAKIREEVGPAGLVIARNVAAHVADLDDFFGGIVDLLAPDGVAVVEVQYLADLLAGNQFDHVYHEHRFYFSLWSLWQVCARAGLRIAKVDWTEQQGGSIRVALLRGHDLKEPEGVWYERERLGLVGMSAYKSFAGRVEYLRGRLASLVMAERRAGRRLAGYGATAKSTTLLNACSIGASLLEYIEDLTPAKIGRYAPGTHIPVVAPGDREPPDVYLLLAWNYLPGVIHRERAFLERGGRFLVPIPVPVLL